LEQPDFCSLGLYSSNQELKEQYHQQVSESDVVIVGSYVQQGVEIGHWALETAKGVVAFYDIDTPVTLAKLKRNDSEYLDKELIAKYDLYLSFSGGPILNHLEEYYHSPMARALYCSVDPALYFPENVPVKWQLGYLGTYSTDRQPPLTELLIQPASRCSEEKFVVA